MASMFIVLFVLMNSMMLLRSEARPYYISSSRNSGVSDLENLKLLSLPSSHRQIRRKSPMPLPPPSWFYFYSPPPPSPPHSPNKHHPRFAHPPPPSPAWFYFYSPPPPNPPSSPEHHRRRRYRHPPPTQPPHSE